MENETEKILDKQTESNDSSAENKVEIKRYISTIPVVSQLSIALGLLVIVFGITYVGVGSSISKTIQDDAQIEKTIESSEYPERNIKNSYDNITLEARSAIVWDVKNERVLFNKNGDESLPLASVAKLMTALLASELLNPYDKISISLENIQTEGDSGLNDGEEFTVQNIIDFILITSSNDGASALSDKVGNIIQKGPNSEKIFVKAMNVRAEELGLTRTYFNNSTGLDISETEAGAYGSARDIARLMAYIIKNTDDAVALTNTDIVKISNENGEYHIAKNTNIIVDKIDGLITSKTGYTELAGGNLVIALNTGLNRPVVVVIFGSSFQGRFDDALNLIERTKTYILNE